MSTALLTGGDGYLGRMLVDRFLAGTDLDVLLAVRAAHAEELAAKRNALEHLGPRVRVVGVDLAGPAPFEDLDLSDVTRIVHGAAVTRFNVEADLAQQVNVEGTRKVLDAARRCRRLERVSVLSTLYSSGLQPGLVTEAPHVGARTFANHYERSKHAAEELVAERAGEVPCQVIRVATVIADDDRGDVRQHNAFHNTLKLYFHGLLSLLPGDPATPLYLVSGRFAADATFALATGDHDGTFHVSHPHASAPTVQDLIDVAFSRFEEDPTFRRRRVLRPVYVDREAYGTFAEAVETFAGGVVTQAVSSVTPFAAQLYVHKQVSTDRLRAGLGTGRAEAGDVVELIGRTCEHLVATRWGRDHRAA